MLAGAGGVERVDHVGADACAANAPNGPRAGCQARIALSSPSLASWAMSSRSQPTRQPHARDGGADQRLVAAQQLLLARQSSRCAASSSARS